MPDRRAIEDGFLHGDINVICCTSTLAVGVNLPCHMVIIKNTVVCPTNEGAREYSDLEIMQMMGRAGRPQFDTNAVAVVMTRQEKLPRYERMVSGQQILESWYDAQLSGIKCLLIAHQPPRKSYRASCQFPSAIGSLLLTQETERRSWFKHHHEPGNRKNLATRHFPLCPSSQKPTPLQSYRWA